MAVDLLTEKSGTAEGAEPLEPIDAVYLERVGRGIYDAGDVQTVYFAAGTSRGNP